MVKVKAVLSKVVEAHIESESADDFDHARINIYRGLAKRILHLAAIARHEDVAFIHDWNYDPELLKADYEDEDKLKEVEVSIDTEQLVVTKDDFWWEGYIKHTDIHWSTDRITLEELRVALMSDAELPKHINREWKSEGAKEAYKRRLAT